MTKEALSELGRRLLVAIISAGMTVGLWIVSSRYVSESSTLGLICVCSASLITKGVASLTGGRWSAGGIATGLVWGTFVGLAVGFSLEPYLADPLLLSLIAIGPLVGASALCRSLGAGLWLGVPTVEATLLVSERQIAIHLSGPLIYDRPSSVLPDLLADLLYHYPATTFATALLVAAALRRAPSLVPSASPFFLPVYIFALESVRHAIWCKRCHGGMAAIDPYGFVADQARRSACAAAGIFVCALIVSGSRQPGVPWHERIPGGVPAALVSVSLIWWMLLKLMEPWSE